MNGTNALPLIFAVALASACHTENAEAVALSAPRVDVVETVIPEAQHDGDVTPVRRVESVIPEATRPVKSVPDPAIGVGIGEFWDDCPACGMG